MVAVMAVVSWVEVWRLEGAAAGSKIHTWADALWWAVVTLFTVGYGDMYPRAAPGRVAGVVLMISGIALFGWLTASLASLFVESEDKVAMKGDHQCLESVVLFGFRSTAGSASRLFCASTLLSVRS